MRLPQYARPTPTRRAVMTMHAMLAGGEGHAGNVDDRRGEVNQQRNRSELDRAARARPAAEPLRPGAPATGHVTLSVGER